MLIYIKQNDLKPGRALMISLLFCYATGVLAYLFQCLEKTMICLINPIKKSIIHISKNSISTKI